MKARTALDVVDIPRSPAWDGVPEADQLIQFALPTGDSVMVLSPASRCGTHMAPQRQTRWSG
jgi:hypothetical protein